MISIIKKHLCFLIVSVNLLFLFSFDMEGQNAPITTASTISDALPGSITVPLTVTGFNFIGAISLTLEFDNSVLNFVQGTQNPLLPGPFYVSDEDQGNNLHRLTMGWFGSAISLPDGSSVMDLQFTYISGATSLVWIDNGGSCEYADGNYNVLNDIPYNDYYINGFVCGAMGIPGPISGTDTLCQLQAGEVYSIDPLPNVTSYNWSVPDGTLIMNGQNTNSITVDFTINAASGNIMVYGLNDCGNSQSSELPVTVNVIPVADAGDDITIPYGTSTTLNAASGGQGNYSYHWSPEELLINPDVQNPETVNLYNTTIFSLLVTDLNTNCQNTDELTLTLTGGPLNVNPIAIPSVIMPGRTRAVVFQCKWRFRKLYLPVDL